MGFMVLYYTWVMQNFVHQQYGWGGRGVEDDGVQEKDMTQLASILHAFLLLFVAGFCCMSMFSHRRAGFPGPGGHLQRNPAEIPAGCQKG